MSWLIYKYEEPIYINICDWFNIGNIEVKYGILLDTLSMVVMVPVGIVTISVLIYALEYMKHDPNRNRFYIILSVFAIFMTILVISNNYIVMFIGWEFVGVISYLLISFWNTRITAMKSALSAILLNRMGDTLYVICIGIMLNLYNAVDFETIELLTPHMNTNILNIIAICLLIAATAKSAQLGLHGWLLHAMEGVLLPQWSNNDYKPALSGFNNKHKLKYINIYMIKFNRNLSKNTNKPLYNQVWVYDINNNNYLNNEPYNSISECSKTLRITRGTISKYIKSGEIFKHKYIFSNIKLDKNDLLNKSINPKIWDIVTGEMLGDGHIKLENKSPKVVNPENINARLEFTFSSKVLYYVNYLKFNVLSDICNNTLPTPYPKDNPAQYWFSTKRMPYITNLHNEWYKVNNEGKYIKKLPDNIENLITPVSLAHWVMGDGYFQNNLIYLCTDNFTKDEVLLLINILFNKFNIKSDIKIRKYYNNNNNIVIHYRIKILHDSISDFINLVKPHMIPEMYYKLGLKLFRNENI